MWHTYYRPDTLEEALALLAEHAGRCRLVAGGTDLVVELQRGIRPTPTVIDLSALAALKYVRAEGRQIRIGALATHNDVIAAPLCVEQALPLAQACLEVGAPQIRARATVAGNLVTASPANDTITPLVALDAEVLLSSRAGERTLPLSDFYLGVRRTALQPAELLREIRFHPLLGGRRGIFLKLGLRRAQAIAVVNVAVVLRLEEQESGVRSQESGAAERASGTAGAPPTVSEARIALGCVAPTIVRAAAAEQFLSGKALTPAVCTEAGRLALEACAPIDDLRSSADYRRSTVAALVAQALAHLAAGEERAGWPARPVLLESPPHRPSPVSSLQSPVSSLQSPVSGLQSPVSSLQSPVSGLQPPSPLTTIETTINGRLHVLEGAAHKTLLDALREDAGLTGTKEGCAEGECGACTIWIDGQAAMACLVPAAQAHGAQITTIEGLAGLRVPSDEFRVTSDEFRVSEEQDRRPSADLALAMLHPLQRAFIEQGAVQCGYCIPGMLMAGAKLLDEHPRPNTAQIQAALGGNICRCTGYRKIFAAVRAASRQDEQESGAAQ